METRIKRRTYTVEPDTVAWLEREFSNSTLYPDIDPFHRVFRLHKNVYTIHEECAGGGSDLWINLIEGPEAALLIDTGYGIGRLAALVRHLVGDKKLYVVNTHEHYDHVMGNSHFEKVYCHEKAVPYITKNYFTGECLEKYYDNDGNGIFLDFTKNDLPPLTGYYLIPCKDGDVFDLGGGHTVEVLYTPGHASGGISLLDRKSRILISGAVHSGNTTITGNNPLYPEGNTVEACLEWLERVVTNYWNDFDLVYAAHELPVLPKQYLLDEIEACRQVIADPTCGKVIQYIDGKPAKYRHTYGTAGLRYTPGAFRL